MTFLHAEYHVCSWAEYLNLYNAKCLLMFCCKWLITTLYIVFSVTYYLKLHNPITMFCMFPFLTNKGQIRRLNIIEHQHLYLVKNYNYSKNI